MNAPQPDQVEIVFGKKGDPFELARGSAVTYVRSLDQLSEWVPSAKGRRLSALEALDAYGLDALVEVAIEGSAVICASAEAVGRVLVQRREQLGLDIRHVATRARVSPEVVQAAEASRRLPIRDCERIARALGLDERFLSFKAEPEGNERIAVRLRVIGDANPRMSHSTVSALAEAAWVAMTQVRLEEALDLRPDPSGIEHNQNYGTPDYPAYQWGYLLAGDARKRLGLGSAPITSLRELSEDHLGLPIIQADLGESIAGATVEAGSRRAIVVNLSGRNRNVYVRRATIAHELGHLLYDPPHQLNDLRVDDYDDLDKSADQLSDRVEQRASAFAVEFLAPQTAALELFHTPGEDPLGAVMDHFGISFTAARYQIWNALERGVPLESLVSDRGRATPEFEARETFTVDYHPVRNIRPTRAGRFSAVVVRAAEGRIVSWDTAAEWLETAERDVRAAAPAIRSLFPAVG